MAYLEAGSGLQTPVVQTNGTGGGRIGDAWSDPRNPIVQIFHGKRLELWSFKPIHRTNPPEVKNTGWVRNPIDQFVLAKMEVAGLTPSGEASRVTLVRRLYFDLTGLPPTPEEAEAFVKDLSPEAYESLVDRLLDSPRYGENWARQWLDVIRYSDSNGFDWDEFRPKAWRFRDYVIRALNSDKPFNEFVREQLAGDELLAGPPRNQQEQDCLIATGYLRLGPHDNSAAAFNEQARSRAELMMDLVDTTGSAFLGMTLACCRCHDHKYDPLSQADHYRMRAFFEGVKFADDLPLNLRDEQKAIRDHNSAIEKRLEPLRKERDELSASIKEKLRADRIAKLEAAERELLNRTNTLDAALKEKREAIEKKIGPSNEEITKAFTPDQKARNEQLKEEIDSLKKQKRQFETGLLMTDAEGEPPVTKILAQGDYRNERAPVEPGFLSVLDPNPAPIRKAPNHHTLGRRLALAEWIVSPTNPLTARVFVNRLWQAHFGKGLVATPNDFGLAGARPTHPELLDWLASEFVRQGWSIKRIQRLIITSAAYRQASSEPLSKTAAPSDSENDLLSHQNLRRLPAEQLRDSLLFVSGQLQDSRGGSPVWPELPQEILTANPALLDDNAEKTKGWYPSPAGQQNVRSIYLIQKRTVRLPFMETFDLPENATSCPRRNESVVAPQALTLLNGSLTIKAARALATRVQKEVGSNPEKQIDRAFALCCQRHPDRTEAQECLALLRERSLSELCRALMNVNEFLYVD